MKMIIRPEELGLTLKNGRGKDAATLEADLTDAVAVVEALRRTADQIEAVGAKKPL